MDTSRELAAALQWVDRTDAIAMEHFAVGVPTETKSDGTPVTIADRAIEEFLRRAIETAFPGDAILGEEHGSSGASARRWIIDPIDATKNYARGMPVFATLIALEIDATIVLGVVSAPALGSRWWAVSGGGAFHNDAPIRVSTVDALARAEIGWGEFGKRRSLWRTLPGTFEGRERGFGDFWGFVLVAQGSSDIMLEPAPIAVWDLAAPKFIVEEAGGRVTDLNDDPTVTKGPVVATNARLHDEVLRALRTGREV